MKRLSVFALALLAIAFTTGTSRQAAAQAGEGWKQLFDGKALAYGNTVVEPMREGILTGVSFLLGALASGLTAGCAKAVPEIAASNTADDANLIPALALCSRTMDVDKIFIKNLHLRLFF